MASFDVPVPARRGIVAILNEQWRREQEQQRQEQQRQEQQRQEQQRQEQERQEQERQEQERQEQERQAQQQQERQRQGQETRESSTGTAGGGTHWFGLEGVESGLAPVNQIAVCPERAASLYCNFYFIDCIQSSSRQQREIEHLRQLNEDQSQEAFAEPFNRNVFGLNWFSRCSGDLQFWDANEQRRKEIFTPENKRNILYSLDWKHSRPEALKANNGDNGHEMVALICNYYLKWKSNDDGARRRGAGAPAGSRAHFAFRQDPLRYRNHVRYIRNGDTTRIYAVVRTWAQLARLYTDLGLADRHMEEILLQNTPQKLYLDVERDLTSQHAVTRPESRSDLEKITDVFERVFIPYLLEFVRSELGIPSARQSDLVVSYSSQAGIKFSAHVVLSTAQGHHFNDRVVSHAAAALMAKFMHDKAQIDPEFKEWYLIDDRNTMIDYSVYGYGQRNMRMIGCCKINSKLYHGMHWKSARVFVPAENAKTRPLKDFIISVYDALKHPERYKRISLTTAQLQAAARFASRGIGARLIRRGNLIARAAGLQLQPSVRNAPHNNAQQQQQHQQQVENANAGQAALVDGLQFVNANGEAGLVGAGGNANDAPLNALLRLMPETNRDIITMLGTNMVEVPPFWDDYYEVGRRAMEHLINGIHPNCSPSITSSCRQTELRSWLLCARLTPYVEGVDRQDGQGKLRYCFLGCTQGHHQVVIYLFNDFSIGYYCYGRDCQGKRIIFPSPIQKHNNRVRPGIAPLRDFAPEIVPHVVEYDEQFMRELEMPENMEELNLGPNDSPEDVKLTYALHASMGTGKTTAVKHLLDKLRVRRPDPRVLSISFRVMLARNASETLGLDYYKDMQVRNLSSVKQLALQMDSLERLLEISDDEDMTCKLVCGHDVVFCDEICSLLSHLNSDTLKDKLNDVWNIFFQIVKHARILIVSDADIGPREQRFLRMTRGRTTADGVPEIPNLFYHFNQRVSIRTKFIEYKGEFEWAQQLLWCAVAKEMNCFVVSNSINQIERLKAWLHERLEQIMDQHISLLQSRGLSPGQVDSDHRVRHMQALYGAIHTITSRSTETEKDRMADSNKAWKEAKVLLISPTVGAGVDFSQEHFHVAFCYATNKSCCARAINQMRGRVRRIESGICHVYINAHVDSTGERAVTPAAALIDLAMSRRGYLLGPVNDELVNQGVVSFSRSLISSRLMEMQAYNAAEDHRSKGNLRMEWIKLQQATDPYVEYIFDNRFNYRGNIDFRALMSRIQSKVSTRRIKQISAQKDLSMRAYKHMINLDRRGKMYEVEEDQAQASVLVDKNQIRQFFAMKRDIPRKDFETFVTLLNVNKTSGLVLLDRLIRIMFVGMQDLVELARGNKLITSKVITATHQTTNEVLHTVHSGQRMAQETEPTDFELQHWVKMLLYACGAGFEGASADLANAFRMHRAIAIERLKTDDNLQKWLKKVLARRLDAFKIQVGKRMLPEKGDDGDYGDFGWSNVYSITKVFFFQNFNVTFISTRTSQRDRRQQQVGDDDEERFEGDREFNSKCGERHNFRYYDEEKRKEVTVYCQCAGVAQDDIDFLVELMFARAHVEGPTELGLDPERLAVVREKLALLRNNLKKPTQFLQMLMTKEEQLEEQGGPQAATAAAGAAAATGNENDDNRTLADINNAAGGDYGYGDYGIYGLDGGNDGAANGDPQGDSMSAAEPADSRDGFGEEAGLEDQDNETIGDENGEDDDDDDEGERLEDDEEQQEQQGFRSLLSLNTSTERKRKRDSESAVQRAKMYVKERHAVWEQAKAPFLQIDPSELDPVGFHDQVISLPCKLMTKSAIKQLINDHTQSLNRFLGRNYLE